MTNRDTGDRIFVDWLAFTYSESPPPPPSQCPDGEYFATYRNETSAEAFTTQLVLTRCEPAQLDYGWGASSPVPGVNADDFTVVWKGNFDFEASDYKFSARSDDGIRVYVDSERTIDRFFDKSATVVHESTRTLTAGTHEVKVEYYENGGDAAAKLSWVKVASAPPPGTAEFGVNLAGAEFSDSVFPGTHGTNYIYPNTQELDYYHSKGQDVIRLPFRWERVQPTLSGPLGAAEAGRIDAVVQAAQQRNMKVILDVHNYGRYKTPSGELLLGSAALPNSAFADLWRKLAARSLKERIEALDEELRARFFAREEAPIITSLPGMGTVLGSEFLVCVGDLSAFESADKLAAYAGLVPAARDSGKRTGNDQRMRGGNKVLKRAFYQFAFASLRSSPESRAFYDRKRREGKRQTQALIALARRRVNVLWAMLRDGTTFNAPSST